MTVESIPGCLTFESEERAAPSPRPAVARVLRQIAVLGLFADVVLLVVAMALGGVEGNVGRAAGALVTLVVLRNRRWAFGHYGLRYQRNEPMPAVEGSFPGNTSVERRHAL